MSMFLFTQKVSAYCPPKSPQVHTLLFFHPTNEQMVPLKFVSVRDFFKKFYECLWKKNCPPANGIQIDLFLFNENTKTLMMFWNAYVSTILEARLPFIDDDFWTVCLLKLNKMAFTLRRIFFLTLLSFVQTFLEIAIRQMRMKQLLMLKERTEEKPSIISEVHNEIPLSVCCRNPCSFNDDNAINVSSYIVVEKAR